MCIRDSCNSPATHKPLILLHWYIKAARKKDLSVVRPHSLTNISTYQRLKPVYDAFQKAKDKPGFKAKHEAELVIFEAARSTLLRCV